MSDRQKFVDGEVYRYDEISPHTFPERGRTSEPPGETLFRYTSGEFYGHFDEVVVPDNPLVDSQQAQLAVDAMRELGWTYREIARRTGVSIEAVHRSASGVGLIRSSTEEALLQVASSLTNGNGQG
jgi:hypothetical protein